MKIKIPDIEIPDVLWEGLSDDDRKMLKDLAESCAGRITKLYNNAVDFPVFPPEYRVSKPSWGSVYLYRTVSHTVEDVDKTFLLILEEVCELLNVDMSRTSAPSKTADKVSCDITSDISLTVYFTDNEVCRKVVRTRMYEDVTYICNS